MCIKFEVTLPTVETFLFCICLRIGSLIILIWTIFRSLFCTLFFVCALLELVVKHKFPGGPILVSKSEVTEPSILPLYFGFVVLIFAEATLLIYTYYFARGLFMSKPKSFVSYLIWRFVTWILEITSLVLVCIFDKQLIGWYLAFLFFVILEVYSFVVVYSHYCDLWEAEECPPCKTSTSCVEVTCPE